MAIQTGLEGKPWYMGAAAGALVAGVFVLGTYMFGVKPKLENIKRLDSKLNELQVKVQEGRAAKQKLPQFREEVRRLELELDKLLRILPARRNTPDLLRRIRQLTEQGNFNLLRFTPGNFLDHDFYSEWPIQISLQGTYHNLALFFDRIGRFSRIINVENLKMSAMNRNPRGYTIGATFVAKTFVYREQPPPTAPEKPGPGKKKKP